MLNELEKLLREVAQQGGRVPPPRRRQPEPEIIDDGVEIIEAEPLYEDVAEHVAESMDTRDVTGHAEQLRQHASQLGTQVGHADEKLEDHLHEKFGHELGRIHDESVTSAGQTEQGEVALAASDIVGMLSNPKSICQAVILNEILQRSTDRW